MNFAELNGIVVWQSSLREERLQIFAMPLPLFGTMPTAEGKFLSKYKTSWVRGGGKILTHPILSVMTACVTKILCMTVRNTHTSVAMVNWGLFEYIDPRFSSNSCAMAAELTTSIDPPIVCRYIKSPTTTISQRSFSAQCERKEFTVLLSPVFEDFPHRKGRNIEGITDEETRFGPRRSFRTRTKLNCV